jgi:hypothetical protein
MKGDTETLIGRAETFMRLAPSPPGMLARTLAETEDGALLATLWSSPDARVSFHRSPEYHAAIASSAVHQAIEVQEAGEYRVRFHDFGAAALQGKTAAPRTRP